MGRRRHNCSQCAHLTRTSPTQVFLLCGFWASSPTPKPYDPRIFDRDYRVSHCHMQPEAPACFFFRPKAGDASADGASFPVAV